MGYKVLISIFVIVFSSCSGKKEGLVEYQKYPMLMPIVENDGDTITNGSLYKTKVYLTNDSLYKIAIQNGIQNYLNIKYEPRIDATFFSRSTKNPSMIGDTAIIEFILDIPNSQDNQIIAHPWQVDINLNFKEDNNLVDTSFIYQSTIYVKQNL